jgi:hypothetical protein
MIYLANDLFQTQLRTTWTAEPVDEELQVLGVPDNIPTLLVAGWKEDNQTVFAITAKSGNAPSEYSLKATRIRGANENLPAGTTLICVNVSEFFNQYRSYLGIDWKGTWADDVEYNENEGVFYEGSSYVALQTGTNQNPATETDYWLVVQAKGDTGSQGIQGVQGEVGSVSAASAVTLTEIATPANPDAGKLKIYAKDDGKVYKLNSSGDEEEVGGVGITLSDIYPIGSIYISTVSTNPGTLFGVGTWEAFGAGKTLVGLDSGDTDFDTVEETGGAKTHTLTTAELAVHTHPVINNSSQSCTQGENGTYNTGDVYAGFSAGITAATDNHRKIGNAGSGNAHNNLQPYIVTYMWKRVS